MLFYSVVLVEEAGLLVLDAQFAVNGGKDTLYLAEGEHTAEEGIAGVVAVGRLVEDATGLVGEGHAVIHTHRQLWVLLLEDAAEFNKVSASAEVACFCEVAIGEDVAGAQMDEVGARSELTGEVHHVVVGTC